jgi:SH3-like domain-containing protein
MTRLAIAFAACLVIGFAAFAAKDLLANETAQAHALVAEGQRDLAKGDRTSAVLAFERAQLVAPRVDFVRSSLATANIEDAESPFHRALRVVTTREWFAVAVASGWISGLAVAVALVRRPQRGARRVAFVASAVLALSAGAIVESNASARAIVTTSNARLLVAPYASATVVSPATPGTMVIVGPLYDGYVHVEDATGNEGWVPQKSIEPIDSKG